MLVGLLLAAVPVFDLPVSRQVMDNGLSIVLQPDPAETMVAVNLRYPVGSMHDPRDREGLAHFTEHLMFQDREGGGFFAQVESAGGVELNAFTTYDHTEYVGLVPPDGLAVLLSLEARRMATLGALSEERIEQEKRTVANELYERLYDAPYNFAEHLLREELFPTPHPLHFGPIGTLDAVEAFTREDAVAFHRDHYGPNDAVLVVAGGFDIEEAKGIIYRVFGPLPRRPERASKTLRPPLRPKKAVHGPAWVASRPRLSLLWPGPVPGSKEAAPLEVLAAMLSYGRVSRAALANMKEESIEGLAAGLMSTPAGNLFRIDAIVAPGVPVQLARHRVQAIVETYVGYAPRDQEMNGVKRRLRLELVRTLASLTSRARLLQDLETRSVPGASISEIAARWDRVSATEIQEALSRYVIGEPVVAVAQPVRR